MSATSDNPLDCGAGERTPGVIGLQSGAAAASDAGDSVGRIVADLGRCGWSVRPEFLDCGRTTALAREVRDLSESDALRPARIGRGGEQGVRAETRGDRIRWLDESHCTATQQSVLSELERLRLAINRRLFLGLFEYEGHFTAYPRGAFYRRHLDQFRDAPQRVVSCVLYLNEDWRDTDGGQLRLYLDAADDSHTDILPRGGTLVTFLSDRFYHEVLPATRERLSLTGWFRVRN